MGFWSIAKGIFAAPKALDTGLDLVKSAADGIDVLFYTDEEKAQARKAWWTDVFIPLEKTLGPQGAIRSVTRRILANDFCKVYLFLFLADVFVYKFDPKWSAHILDLIKILTYPVSAIILFFFGSYGVGTYILNKKKKLE